MSKRLLTYLILALVVFQSAAGVADAHQSHQSGTEHLTFDDHQHTHDDIETHDNLVDGTEGQERDCHHCCHCHGHLNHAVLIKPLGFTLNQSPTSVSDYSESFPSKVINPLLRPPIAHT